MESRKNLLTLQAPRIWTRGIGLVTPEKSDLVTAINCDGNVLANQSNSPLPMHCTVGLSIAAHESLRLT